MNNAFLMEFMKMRQQIGSPDTTGQNKKKEKVQLGGANEKHLSGISLATIIEKKPSAKVVMKYFKKKYGDASSSDED
jgi:hypothetical protein